jgi:hypothetical protein
MNLQDFCFPVEQRPVSFISNSRFYDWNTKSYIFKPTNKPAEQYKAIVRDDNNALISIVNRNYKLVPNKDLIDQLMKQLERTDQKYEIEAHHSFVRNNRMRLHILFPELRIKDDSDDGIALSLFLHNSYDLSEGVRMYWGAIRSICTNGMVFGKVLAKFYGKHTKGFKIEDVKSSLENTYKMIPDIQQRIDVLDSLEVNEKFEDEVHEHMGTRLVKHMLIENGLDSLQSFTQLQLFHLITNYISHRVKHELQARYQMASSKLFNL